jgi:hypothetical protein
MITTASGTRFYIGTTTLIGSGSPAFEYGDDTYTEVGEVQNLGEFGDEAPLVNFAAIGDARVRKLKGARDAGTLALVCGRDPLDAGQQAMVDAEATKFEYNFKVVAADAPTEGHSDTVYYFRGLVTSRRENYGENDNVVTRTFNIAINTAITEEEVELTSP